MLPQWQTASTIRHLKAKCSTRRQIRLCSWRSFLRRR
nr:MAG TPA: hypothetical protein [Inoviridae sp.]